MVIGVCRPIKQIDIQHFHLTQMGCLKDFSAEGYYKSWAGAPFNGVPNPQSGWVYRSNSKNDGSTGRLDVFPCRGFPLSPTIFEKLY